MLVKGAHSLEQPLSQVVRTRHQQCQCRTKRWQYRSRSLRHHERRSNSAACQPMNKAMFCRTALRCRAASDTGDAPPVKEPCRAAAELAVDLYVSDGSAVGLGTGLMVSHVIEYLAERMEKGTLTSIKCVPASDQSASEVAYHGLPVASFEIRDPGAKVDVAFEEVDEVHEEGPGLSCVLGRASEPRQPQLVRARQLAEAAGTYVALVEGPERVVTRLAGNLPVVIEGEDWEETAEELDSMFLGDAEVWRRGQGAPHPRGGENPYLSPDGYNLLDIKFYGSLKLYGKEVGYLELEDEIHTIPGVVTTGLLVRIPAAAVVAAAKGPYTLTVQQSQEAVQ